MPYVPNEARIRYAMGMRSMAQRWPVLYKNLKRTKTTKSRRKLRPSSLRLKKPYLTPYDALGAVGNPLVEKKFMKTSSPFPFPQKWQMNLVYGLNNVIDINSLSNHWKGYQYRLSSIYDPDLTGGGHQPLGRDQVAPLYARYIVKGVYYDILIHYPSHEGMMGGLSIRNENDGALYFENTNLDYPLERTGCAVKAFPVQHGNIRFKGYADLYKLGHFTSKQSFMENASAPVNDNPAVGNNVFLYVGAIDPNGTFDAKAVRITGTLTYKVMFYDPIGVGQS